MKGDSKLALAFWYFNANDKATMSLVDCVRALITQLLRRFTPKLPVCILELWETKGKLDETPKLPDLVATLQKLIVEEKSTYYFVLDALDETKEEDQEDLIQMLQRLLTTAHDDVHILVTSRPYVKDMFQERFQNDAFFFDIAIERIHVDMDIEAHIEEQLRSDPKLSHWNPEVRQLISSSLLAKAEGM